MKSIKVYCNKCSREIPENELGYPEDHLSVTKKWGYGSPIDGDKHSFDLCFECYKAMTEEFEIPI